jgi:hypothetical protein
MRAFYSPRFSSIFLPSACSAAILSFTLTALPPAAEAQVTALDPNYTVSLLASGLQLPTGGFIYRPTTNDLLVTQEDLGLVSRVDATSGAVSTVASLASYSITNHGHYVWELNVNSAGEIWVPLLDNGPVVRLDASGAFLGSFSIPGCGGAVAFDAQDNAYLGIGCPASIYEYPKGNFSSPTLYASGFSGTESFRFNKAGQMFVADRAPGIVYQVTPGGISASSHTVWASGLTLPDGIAIDPITQYVYVGDESGNVTRITAPGVFSTFATGFSSAIGLGFDTAGNLYVGDKFVGAVWKFTRNMPTALPTITPNHGGNAGSVTVRITGQGLESSATVTLSGSSNNIVGTNTTLLNTGILGTTFDLTSAVPGVRDVVVNNPDGTSLSLPQRFSVTQGGNSQLSVDVVGLNKIRIGFPQTFYVTVSNTGSVDSPPVVLTLNIPAGLTVAPLDGSSLYAAGIESTSLFGNTTAQSATTAFNPFALSAGSTTNVNYVSPRVPPGETLTAPFQLTDPFGVSTSDFTVTSESEREQYPDTFDEYLQRHGMGYYTSLSCSQCDSTDLTRAFVAADTAYTSFQNYYYKSLDDFVGLTFSTGESLAEAYAMERFTLGATLLEKSALSFLVKEGKSCLYTSLDNPDNQGCLSSLDSNMEATKEAAKAALTSTPVLPPVVNDVLGRFVAFADVATSDMDNIGAMNSDLAAEQEAFNAFMNLLPAYITAYSTYEACLNSGGSISSSSTKRVAAATAMCTPQPPPSVPPEPDTFSLTISPVSSLDPNLKVGTHGVGVQQYISGSSKIGYLISFANKDSATAPAQKVSITDQLNLNLDDAATVALGPIAFGDQVVTPPPFQTSFSTTVDLRPAKDLLVAIDAHLDFASGLMIWTYTSLDPMTGQPPADPTVGFLPPGGIGSSFFTVVSKQNLATGTAIENTATVVFDANAPINTPAWTNTVDSTAPTSHVSALPSTVWTAGFTVSWTGTDVGSGIQDYTIYVSDNGGTFTAWQTNATATSASFTGQVGHTYAFYSIATDNAGNVEAVKTAAEASTEVTEPTQVTPTVTLTPSSTSITTTQALTIAVAVNGGSGSSTPSGSVTLMSGTYTSAPTTLGSGAATITIPTGSLSAGMDTLLVTYTPDTTSSSTYNSASGSVSVSVQGYPIITWPTPAAITYGTALSTTQLDATASVAGSFTYVPSSGTVLNAGSQTLGATFKPTDTTDYLPVSGSVTLVVNKASQVITFTGLPASATYGAAGPYTLNSTGGASGNAVTYAVTGPASIAGSILTIIGAGTVTVTASQAGNTNYMAATPVSQTILVGKAASTTVLGAASTTPAQGTADLLKVTVTGAGQQPSGTVQFIAGTTALCTNTLSAGVATCSYVPSASGSVLVLAQYQGDTNHLGSSASLTLTVYDTAITLKVRKAELFYSERLEGEVCVISAIRVRATGTVEILDGTTLLVTRELRRDGCTHWEDRSELSVGTHVLTAVYSGDNNNPAGISAPVTVTVNPVPVDLDAFCGDNRFPYGSNYDCKVSVHSHAGPAEGSITYSFDGAAPVTLPLSNGTAEFTITRPAVGTHTVVVAYAQQTNYAAAGPQTRDFTVTLAPVNVNLTLNPSKRTVEAGTSVTFKADVTSWSAGPPNATGAVSFSDGNNLLATVPVNPSGKADYATASLTIGYHTITATYSGGANYASGSNSVTIMITR